MRRVSHKPVQRATLGKFKLQLDQKIVEDAGRDAKLWGPCPAAGRVDATRQRSTRNAFGYLLTRLFATRSLFPG